MQLKAPKSRNMASLKDEEQAATTSNSTNNLHNNNNNTNNINNNSYNNNNKNEDDPKVRKENLEARKQALEQRLSEKSWLLQQIQKQETAIINGNYEQMTVNEFFVQLAQQYKHEQQLQALARENSSILRRKQSTTSRESRESQMTNNNNNNRQSETLSNRSSEYDNYQPSSSSAGAGDMLVIGVAQQQAQQQPPLVKSALKKRPTPTPSQMQYMRQQQQHQQQQAHLVMNMNYQRTQPDVISMYSANSSNVATLRQPPQVAPQQQPIIVQCDKYYLSPTHQSYNEGGFIKSSQNIKKYVSPLASPSNHSYEQRNPLLHQQQRQLDAISLAPSYISVDMEAAQHQQQYRWRSQSHIAPLTPPQLGIIEVKSHSSDMLAVPMPPSRYAPHDEISLSSSSTTTIEKKPKSKQWMESSLDGPAVIRQMDSQPHSPAGSSNGSSITGAAAMATSKPRAKLSSQSMSVAGRHYSMSNQRPAQNYPSASYAVNTSSKALLSQSTSYLNAMEQTLGISVSYPLEPLDIPALRNLPPKPSQMQQPTPPPRPPPANQNLNHSGSGSIASGLAHGNANAIQTALVSPPLTVATASLSPEIRIESPKNMTVVQQATFQPYKEVTKPFEMSDFYKYSTKFKQKESGNPN
ncbi:myb-like protein AA [Drosophila takahashii]|uniref:myb-like protein AA n=1 Tax=Drosophila takahashii TaxID=29030 RepID=UPI001CF921B7|nr:probable basic-leucine zipper transcription factor R [Drosophila takahashii]